MKRSEAVDSLADALAKAQGQMEGALKQSANPFFKSKYADLASVWSACRKALADNNLSVVQTPRCEHPMAAVNELKQAMDGQGLPPSVIVTTVLMHNSGQWIENELQMWPRENTPQAIGSCISYARRYSLASMVGVYQEDDDAERATHGSTDPVSLHTEAELQAQLNDLVKAIKANDFATARTVWNEANTLGTVSHIWKLLNTKQKKAARDLLQQTYSPPHSPQLPPKVSEAEEQRLAAAEDEARQHEDEEDNHE